MKSPAREKVMGMSLHQLVYLALFLAVVAVILGGLGTKAYYDVVDNPDEEHEMGDLRINGAILEYKQNVITLTESTKTVSKDESGSIFHLDRAAGMTITLPAAEKGLKYTFIVKTTFTGTLTINADSTADTLQGLIIMGPSLTGTATNAGATTLFAGPAAADHQLISNGSTTGGLLGSRIMYECVDPTKWVVSGAMITTGNTATPFT